MVKIVTINNVKGGVGKTTTAINLAAGLARKGKKVLLIDTDHQKNTTDAICNQRISKTIKDVFQDTPIQEAIYPSVEAGLDIIPSCLALSAIEPELFSACARETILRRALEPIRDGYDVIIIDTQPSISVIPMNTLCVADEVIIPVYEAFAVDAIGQMIDVLTLVKKTGLNPGLRIGGILLTMYDPRTNVAKTVREKLMEKFKTVMFETVIPRNVKLVECTRKKQSIYEYDPDSKGAKAYQAFTEEIMERWGMTQ